MQQRTANVARPLTYSVPEGLDARVGEVVRVPLGPRELYAFVISAPYATDRTGLRPIASRFEAPATFDETALELARWMAERYCCSLGEALAPFVFAAAIPRTVDRFTIVGPLDPALHASVPRRLLALLRDTFAGGFALESLLRHPEARRAGDRKTLLRAISTLVRAGALERRRTFDRARTEAATEKVLEATGARIRGPRAEALVAHVAAEGALRRRDALLEGYSASLIARAIAAGALREVPRAAARAKRAIEHAPHDFVPTAEQAVAIGALEANVRAESFGEFLLQGVTGSGKTFVYVRAIAQVLARGGRAILLVPEIALTPQTARRFEGTFGDRVAVLHSGLSERERFDSWHAAARGEIDVMVGPRSALFAPLPDVRLIAVDEVHERTYKQDGVPRYHAVDVARERMRLAGGTLVLGSATPPLEEYRRALEGDAIHLRLQDRPQAQSLPETHVVDMAREFDAGNRRIFSSRLVDALAARLERGEKSVLLVNRRGSASFMLCRSCGMVPDCGRCSISLTVHRAENLLRCHQCDYQAPIPAACPNCGSEAFRELGLGTQRVVDTLASLFPKARAIRMDGDTTTRVGDHARLLDEFAATGDILVGTQMIAKGLDFPTVTLAAVVAADLGLHYPEFRASERTFDLLTQVAGRSGRARPGEAILQTYSPEHPAIAFAAKHDFDGFAAYESEQRREAGYPPFCDLVYLGVIGRDRELALAASNAYAETLRTFADAETLGPAPYPVARANNEWRFRIAIKAQDGRAVRDFLRERIVPAAHKDRATRLVINVDP
ncbi:MAG: primosomal protein N' [Candidatus Eremiobacteraeota bacterium]|nr:primosomal protein N' [Candidatus Eremiobacteraeota bacterium]